MMKDIWIFISIITILLSGCSASIVASSDTLGGVQEGPKWGIVKYLNQGADAVISERQKDARKIMEKFCNPNNYKVVGLNEKDKSTFFDYDGTGGGGGSSYVYIKFECVE